MLQEAMKKRDFSEDAVILAKAAVIIRNDVFDYQCPQFNGSFILKYQDSLPSSLKSLIFLIFNGPNIKKSIWTRTSGLSLRGTVHSLQHEKDISWCEIKAHFES